MFDRSLESFFFFFFKARSLSCDRRWARFRFLRRWGINRIRVVQSSFTKEQSDQLKRVRVLAVLVSPRSFVNRIDRFLNSHAQGQNTSVNFIERNDIDEIANCIWPSYKMSLASRFCSGYYATNGVLLFSYFIIRQYFIVNGPTQYSRFQSQSELDPLVWVILLWLIWAFCWCRRGRF